MTFDFEMIQQAYGGQERYRLMPLLRLIDVESSGDKEEQAQTGTGEIGWLQAIERRAKALPIGPGQVPWQFRLANPFVLPLSWLRQRDSGRLEERLMNLWKRQGLHPPAEVWLTFQKSRWSYVSFGTPSVSFCSCWEFGIWGPLFGKGMPLGPLWHCSPGPWPCQRCISSSGSEPGGCGCWVSAARRRRNSSGPNDWSGVLGCRRPDRVVHCT